MPTDSEQPNAMYMHKVRQVECSIYSAAEGWLDSSKRWDVLRRAWGEAHEFESVDVSQDVLGQSSQTGLFRSGQ